MNDAGHTRGRVLVTGATGFIGRDLVGWLAACGWQVRAAARDRRGIAAGSGVEAVALGDLAGGVDWRALVEGVTHVVHLAGIAHATTRISDATYRAVNAEAVRTLAVAARAAGVARVVMMSSVRAQCGPAVRGTLSETRAPTPVDAYGRSKLEGEQMLADVLAGSATDWCVLRPVVVYGPGVKANMASLAWLARTPWPLPIGALQARRSILGLVNLRAGVLHALMHPAASRGTYLIADPKPVSIADIVAAMRLGLGRAPGIFTLPLAPARLALNAAGRGAVWERIAGDLVVSTAALEATGWRPVEISREGLARWMRESDPSRGA